jgi:hypothetical protein
MKDTIAETKIAMKSPTGDSKAVHVEIGRPYVVSAEEAACPIAMTGLYPHIQDIHGTDTLQALALALEFVRITIRKWEEKGFTFEFPDGRALPSTIWFEQKKD